MAGYSQHFFSPEVANNSWSNIYSYIPEGARVLDVGCATGNFGAALQDLKGCTVVGVDIDEDDVAEAATKLSAAYVLDITQPEAAEKLGAFDIVIFADVIEHLPDATATLRAAKELLSEGGAIVYSIPNMAHLSVRLDLLAGRFPYTELGLLDRTHLHFYDRTAVHDVFASAGLLINSELPTITGYPQELISERLRALGLMGSPEFFALISQTDGHVFQYIGSAGPIGVTPAVSSSERAVLPPLDEVLVYAERVTQENAFHVTELNLAREQLEAIRSRPVRSVLRGVKRRLLRR